jgi:steroid delta-isomerase-like uncharacterized protein
MEQNEMITLVEQHLKAEGAGDVDGSVAVYTEDIVHDATGKDGARDFYSFLTANFRTENEEPLHRFFDGDAMILEQTMTGSVIGELLGLPGNGRRVSFRILHFFGFRDGLISREQVWIDSGAIMAQLSAA